MMFIQICIIIKEPKQKTSLSAILCINKCANVFLFLHLHENCITHFSQQTQLFVDELQLKKNNILNHTIVDDFIQNKSENHPNC